MIDATDKGLWSKVGWEANPHLRPPQDDVAESLWWQAMDIHSEQGGEVGIFEIYDALRAQETGGE